MARFLLRALTCLAPAALAVAQPAPSASPSPVQSPHGSPSQKEGWGHHSPSDDKGGGPFQRFKKRLEQMSPEERERFKENWKHWKEMGDREREEFRQRAAREHACMEQSIDDAIAKLGLALDSDQKEVFALRYKQERRKIEEALCQEMKAKREQQLDDMLQRLKTEFTAPKPTATAAPSPAGK